MDGVCVVRVLPVYPAGGEMTGCHRQKQHGIRGYLGSHSDYVWRPYLGYSTAMGSLIPAGVRIRCFFAHHFFCPLLPAVAIVSLRGIDVVHLLDAGGCFSSSRPHLGLPHLLAVRVTPCRYGNLFLAWMCAGRG
jgi:hypothetical protein